jgi:hypothetical protein
MQWYWPQCNRAGERCPRVSRVSKVTADSRPLKGHLISKCSARLKRCPDTTPEFFSSLPRCRAALGWTGEGARPHTSLRFADVGAVLEVVLENLRGQGGSYTLSLSLSLSLGFDGADHFSATEDFGGRQAGNFWRQHEANLQ